MADKKKSKSIWDMKIVRRALWDSLVKLDPRNMMKNPVMFVVEVGSLATSILLIRDVLRHQGAFGFNLQITLWLWFTVLFANFAEAMAEGRGKAQADSLRKARAETIANRLLPDGKIEQIASSKLRAGDLVRVVASEFIPSDGEILEGVASVDESAITGESAPVIREAGGDRSAVTGGTRVLSDWLKIKITSNPGETFLDRMIASGRGSRTPEDAERNCAEYFVGGADDYLFVGCCDLAAVRDLFRFAADSFCVGLLAGLLDSDNDRRTSLRHRNRRHGPLGAT